MDQEPSASPATSPQQRHHPSPEDVSQVRKHLVKLAPIELADVILQEAEYWPRIISHVKEDIRIQALGPDVWNVYLVSEPIPKLGTGGSAAQVERVRFEIKSHDQGWCDEEFCEPYAGSWSWFDAVVLSESESVDLQDPVKPGDIKEIQDLNNRAWVVQRNQRAQEEQKTHEVVWKRGVYQPLKSNKNGAGNGSKRGAKFVESLKGGDRIALVARARFPGWENVVSEAILETFYSV
ncbi:hypothetical protein AX16_006635 [Volvariella volvacea WC 439]|nr:hypothetical protein AX16_006635 [Volvariella volvacea WC 439]